MYSQRLESPNGAASEFAFVLVGPIHSDCFKIVFYGYIGITTNVIQVQLIVIYSLSLLYSIFCLILKIIKLKTFLWAS